MFGQSWTPSTWHARERVVKIPESPSAPPALRLHEVADSRLHPGINRACRRLALAGDPRSIQPLARVLRPRAPGQEFRRHLGISRRAKRPFATAEFYKLEKDRSYRLAATAALVIPVAPIDFFVTDKGFLVTLDNWHNMGYGKVVAFYSSWGNLLRAYALSDLFKPAEIEAMRHSVSSIWWRNSSGCYVRQG